MVQCTREKITHATIAISVVQLHVQQSVVGSCLGWRSGECLYPRQSRGIVKSRDRWWGWPSLCLSACQSSHHSPTTSTTTESLGKTTVVYRLWKKTRGTESSRCDTLTRDFLLKTQALPSNIRRYGKRGNQRKKEDRNKEHWLYTKWQRQAKQRSIDTSLQAKGYEQQL